MFTVPYEDQDGRLDRHSLVVVAREKFGAPWIDRSAGRPVVAFRAEDGALPYDVVGFHALDRSQNKGADFVELRREYFREVASQMVGSRAVILCDANNTYGVTKMDSLFRKMGPFVDRFPTKNPGEPQNKFERVISLAQRLSAMTEGLPMNEFIARGFEDADFPDLDPTKRLLGKVGVQLDHILVRNVTVIPGSTTLHKPEGLSDHYAVSASLEL